MNVSRDATRGFTLIEMLATMAIVGTLASISIPPVQEAVTKARVARAIGDISAIQSELVGFMSEGDSLPSSLAAIGRAGAEDPWGQPYVYFPFPTPGSGSGRTDQFGVPLNTYFDLYSVGEDGASSGSLGATASRDDIVRANDGGFVGLGSSY